MWNKTSRWDWMTPATVGLRRHWLMLAEWVMSFGAAARPRWVTPMRRAALASEGGAPALRVGGEERDLVLGPFWLMRRWTARRSSESAFLRMMWGMPWRLPSPLTVEKAVMKVRAWASMSVLSPFTRGGSAGRPMAL